jgi:uncharacterized iron-regulated membrane protein
MVGQPSVLGTVLRALGVLSPSEAMGSTRFTEEESAVQRDTVYPAGVTGRVLGIRCKGRCWGPGL